MRCPVCIEAGTESRVYPMVAVGRRGDMPPRSIFYDETGRYHVHDPRPIVKRFECSNGHRFRTEELETCGACRFGAEAAKTFVEKGPIA